MTQSKISYKGYTIEEKMTNCGYAYPIAEGEKVLTIHIIPKELTNAEAEELLKKFVARRSAEIILKVEYKGVTLTQDETLYTQITIIEEDGHEEGMDGYQKEKLTEENAKKTIEAFLKAYEERKKARKGNAE